MADYVTHAEFQEFRRESNDRFAAADARTREVLESLRISRSATWRATGLIVASFIAVVALVLAAVDTGRESAAREFTAVATKLEAMSAQSAARIEAASIESGRRIEAALQASGRARASGTADLPPNIIINVPPATQSQSTKPE